MALLDLQALEVCNDHRFGHGHSNDCCGSGLSLLPCGG
jgi:hypothetical protein